MDKDTHSVDTDQEDDRHSQHRMRGLALHFAGYFIITVLVAINLFWTKGEPWFVQPMVGWGSVLAAHVAWVMGLFDGLFRDK